MDLKKTMYVAQTNSRETISTSSLSTSGIVLTVLDAGLLPDAPNLLVIGAGSTAETVLMTAKTDNVLTISRAFQGVAKAWDVGTIVARNYTAYDHDSFKENIEDLYSVVTINGSSIGQIANKVAQLSNPNIADNGELNIWQKGSHFISTQLSRIQHCADRWYFISSDTHPTNPIANQITCDAILNGGALITAKASPLAGCTFFKQAIVAPDTSQLSNYCKETGIFTLSFEAKADKNISFPVSLIPRTGVPIDNEQYANLTTNYQKFSFVFDLKTHANTNWNTGIILAMIGIYDTPIAFLQEDVQVSMKWIKIEQGNIATPLVSKEPETEIANCKRYFQKPESVYVLEVVDTPSQLSGFSFSKMVSKPTIKMIPFGTTILTGDCCLSHWGNHAQQIQIVPFHVQTDGFLGADIIKYAPSNFFTTTGMKFHAHIELDANIY